MQVPAGEGAVKVALSGASGNIASLLRGQLPRHGIDLRSAGWKPSIAPQHEGEDVMNGDLRNAAFVDRILEGVDRIRSTPSHNPTKVMRL